MAAAACCSQTAERARVAAPGIRLLRLPSPVEQGTVMTGIFSRAGLVALAAAGLAPATASAQYYPPPVVYQYYAAPAPYRYYAPPPAYPYYAPPVAYYSPYVLYYPGSPAKRFWNRQARYNRY
jgi:hypothetical protein